MIWIITCLDKPGALPTRLEVIGAHRRYLSEAKIKILMSGPLVEEDGETMKGSFFMVEADSRDEVMAFHQNDPMYSADVWDRMIIEAFNKRVDNLSAK